MMLDTLLPVLMSERPQVLKSNTDRIYLLGYPVPCRDEGLCPTECFSRVLSSSRSHWQQSPLRAEHELIHFP